MCSPTNTFNSAALNLFMHWEIMKATSTRFKKQIQRTFSPIYTLNNPATSRHGLLEKILISEPRLNTRAVACQLSSSALRWGDDWESADGYHWHSGRTALAVPAVGSQTKKGEKRVRDYGLVMRTSARGCLLYGGTISGEVSGSKISQAGLFCLFSKIEWPDRTVLSVILERAKKEKSLSPNVIDQLRHVQCLKFPLKSQRYVRTQCYCICTAYYVDWGLIGKYTTDNKQHKQAGKLLMRG